MDFDAVVIGGGAVGLAVWLELAERGGETLLLERHPTMGFETSSRNSEVIHGGMYYAPGSLKARFCVEGRRLLYPFLEKHGVRHAKCGKLIVAVNAEDEEALEKIFDTGQKNDVEGLRFASGDEIAAREPNVRAATAMVSPETGIVDAHGFMHALEKAGEAAGGVAVCGAEVRALERTADGWTVVFVDANGENRVEARTVVNAAGLSAQRVMRMAGLDPDRLGLTLHPCKGCYFSLSGGAGKKINGLVYPAPEKNLAGLGIHTIVDLAGRVRLGPSVQYIDEADRYDYAVDPGLLDLFLERASRYLPFLAAGDLAPDFSGVRPKLSGPGDPARDFYVNEETENGAPGFVNLAGIESPGLTSGMAIAKEVARLVG